MRSSNMEKRQTPKFSVSDFLAVVNQSLDVAFGDIEVEGEISSFKLNQQKYIFFDLKDKDGSVGCFMMAWQLRMPIEDGMKVVVRAVPKVTNWGKFSLTVQAIRPVGEGSLKKSFELLKAKLAKEGLFDESRKRSLPSRPTRVAIISSTQAAGYLDFVKIANERLGGTHFDVYHTRVQGEGAADDIITALERANHASEPYEVIVIVRGGGSQDDLAVFSDEKLVRAVVGSRVPVMTGIGHEVDETLIDFAADVRAATPSQAAYLLLPSKDDLLVDVRSNYTVIERVLGDGLRQAQTIARDSVERCRLAAENRLGQLRGQIADKRQLIESYNPENILARGYSLLRGEVEVGAQVEIITKKHKIKAEVKSYEERSRTVIG